MTTTVPQFRLTSADMTDGAPLGAAQYGRGAGGDNLSPQLSWSGFPPQTQSFVVTTHDPDAPGGSGFWHWAVFNLPASVTSLDAGAGSPGSRLLPRGAITLANDAGQRAYTGAAPPRGTGPHRYQFVVHAVDVARLDVARLDVAPDATPAELGMALHTHTLARAMLQAPGVHGGATAAR